MGSMQTYETVQMVTDGNGNGNGNIVKWVVDPFCDDNSNGKSANTYDVIAIAVAITMWTVSNVSCMMTKMLLPLPSTSYEQISNVIIAIVITL